MFAQSVRDKNNDILQKKQMLQICLYQNNFSPIITLFPDFILIDVFIKNRTLVRFGGISGEFG